MTTADLKNVIVIGAAAAGHNLANALAGSLPKTHRVILIDRSDWTLFNPNVVRALVIPGDDSKNLIAPLTQQNVFRKGSRNLLITGNSVVELRKTSVVLEKPFEGAIELFFDRCVIATGAQNPLPMRPITGQSSEDYKKHLVTMQKEIEGATKVLIVGGGSVGVEVAGEITSRYPGKHLTIVHNQGKLLHSEGPTLPPSDPHEYFSPPTPAYMSDALEKQLLERGAEIVLGDRVVFPAPNTEAGGGWDGRTGALGRVMTIPLMNGGTVEADYIFLSTGNKANSQLVEAVDPGALTINGKLIVVDQYLAVVPSSPQSVMAGHYYAIGDVAAAPGWRTYVNATNEANALGGILAAEIKGKTPKPYKAGGATMAVTLGANGGSGVLTLPLVGAVSLPGLALSFKSTSMFAQKTFYSPFQGSEAVPTTY